MTERAAPLLVTLARQAVHSLLLPLHPVLADASVTEVMVNGPDHIWVERGGALARVALHLPRGQLEALARLLANLARCPRFEQAGTLETAWQHWRVTLVLPPVARDAACLCHARWQTGTPARRCRHSPVHLIRPLPGCSIRRLPPVPTSWCPAAPVPARPPCWPAC